MNKDINEQLEAAEQAFSAAMISNDPDAIRQCITDDWILVTPESGPVSAEKLLDLIAAGNLTHDTMTKTTYHRHILGDVATVTGRGQNSGRFHGEPISADEWITDVYQKVDGTWRCVLTHLAPALAKPEVRIAQ
ncbi:nuclear transport factor 2 family protein [Oceaniovalibus sp. ACAM 378]|uniref:nuclear transport factor 2 family protein n=1 Tax=Oceaniovalibus sp. ACAM 378 TaxID=2599923 RepID=UPI0011D738CD|nr:nuclear transport factor 2 family protein [Oceaniovalibus sp. ACAM 378]TYB86100.1 nuclear transport factor 2 family protein [Oceaniovalibus sp. ACAM 378]